MLSNLCLKMLFSEVWNMNNTSHNKNTFAVSRPSALSRTAFRLVLCCPGQRWVWFGTTYSILESADTPMLEISVQIPNFVTINFFEIRRPDGIEWGSRVQKKYVNSSIILNELLWNFGFLINRVNYEYVWFKGTVSLYFLNLFFLIKTLKSGLQMNKCTYLLTQLHRHENLALGITTIFILFLLLDYVNTTKYFFAWLFL